MPKGTAAPAVTTHPSAGGAKLFGPLDASKTDFSNAQLSAMGYTAQEIDQFRAPPAIEDSAALPGAWKGVIPAWAK